MVIVKLYGNLWFSSVQRRLSRVETGQYLDE